MEFHLKHNLREKLDKPTDQLSSKYNLMKQIGSSNGGKSMFESLNIRSNSLMQSRMTSVYDNNSICDKDSQIPEPAFS